MTVRLQEGFDWLSGSDVNQELLNSGYYYYQDASGSSSKAVISPGAFGDGKALSFTSSASAITGATANWGLLLPLDTVESEVRVGVRLYVLDNNLSGQARFPWIMLYNGVTPGTQLSVSFHDYGIIRLWRGTPDAGTILATSAIAKYETQRWFFVEIGALIANSGGYAEVRINTETVLSVVSQDTQALANADVDSIVVGARSTSTFSYTFYMDDIYTVDLAGTVNNDYLGNVRTLTSTIIADGDNIDFSIGGTAPAATNWQSVANTALDDTKYVYDGTPGDYDLYDINPILNSPLVHSIQVKGALRMDDATQRTGNYVIKTGGVTDVNAETHYVNQSWTFYWSRWEINPDTLVQFTGAEVNALQVGVEVN